MHYDPKLLVFHERRPTPRSFARQMFKYGRGRGDLMRRNPATTRAAYLAPALLLLYLLMLPALLVYGGALSLIPLLLYAGLILAGASRARGRCAVRSRARRGRVAGACEDARTLRRAIRAPLAAALTVLLHVSYGAGVLRGGVGSTPRAHGRRDGNGGSTQPARWEEDRSPHAHPQSPVVVGDQR
ncbi:MAG: hypothetical protein ACR2ND_03570 [Solirubrobacteraceae bacterium]